jgi:hypothetical protein
MKSCYEIVQLCSTRDDHFQYAQSLNLVIYVRSKSKLISSPTWLNNYQQTLVYKLSYYNTSHNNMSLSLSCIWHIFCKCKRSKPKNTQVNLTWIWCDLIWFGSWNSTQPSFDYVVSYHKLVTLKSKSVSFPNHFLSWTCHHEHGKHVRRMHNNSTIHKVDVGCG